MTSVNGEGRTTTSPVMRKWQTTDTHILGFVIAAGDRKHYGVLSLCGFYPIASTPFPYSGAWNPKNFSADSFWHFGYLLLIIAGRSVSAFFYINQFMQNNIYKKIEMSQTGLHDSYEDNEGAMSAQSLYEVLAGCWKTPFMRQ